MSLRRTAWGGLVIAIATTTAPAHAEEDGCAIVYESAQRLRAAGKLRGALDAAITCARQCPNPLKKDCTDWLDPIRDAIPSLSVRVLGRDGCDVANASVVVDDPSVIGRGDGRAFDVDPGPHELVTRLPSGEERRSPVVLAQGDRDRPVLVSFAAETAVCGRAKAPPTGEPTTRREVPVVTWIFGGVGIASLGLATGFGISGLDQMSNLDACCPRCSHADTDSMRSTFLVADVALAVGVLSLAAATFFWFSAPRVERSR